MVIREPGKYVRVQMKTAGCTGLMYEVVLDEKFDVNRRLCY